MDLPEATEAELDVDTDCAMLIVGVDTVLLDEDPPPPEEIETS